MQKYKPTEAELEILSILWESGPSTVKAINDQLNLHKEVGYTTSLKILQIMYDKKIVERKKSGRSHIYQASINRHEIQNALLDKILKTAFSGSASKLVMQLVGRENTSKDEIEEIQKYLDSIKESENGSK